MSKKSQPVPDGKSNSFEINKKSINFALRIFMSFVWLFPIMLVVEMLVGGIVGAMDATPITTYEEGLVAGENASQLFFSRYGIYVYLSSIALWIILSVLGILPGTGKYKRLIHNK